MTIEESTCKRMIDQSDFFNIIIYELNGYIPDFCGQGEGRASGPFGRLCFRAAPEGVGRTGEVKTASAVL